MYNIVSSDDNTNPYFYEAVEEQTLKVHNRNLEDE